MGSKLQITLFGMPNFHLQSRPDLQISSRKAIALLVFLVSTGKEHSRESLAEMLWEGRTQTQSMANLRVLLTRLRHSMGDYLIITRESVAFNLDRETWIDVKLFEDHMAAAERIETETGSLSTKASEEILQAISLYQSSFLEGFYVRNSPAFEVWVRQERARLSRLSLEGLNKLTAWFQDQKDFNTGIKYTRKWLHLDPLSESAHAQLIMLYALNGQRSSAIRQYEQCKKILKEELGVDPLESTKTLYENILAGSIGEPDVLSKTEGTPGTTTQGYELGEMIGRGAFGVVYQARQVLTKREVAIKVILPIYANHPEFIRGFDFEARRIARLEHMHIVPLYDFWRGPSSANMVMRWMRGGNLEARLSDGPMNLEQAALLVNQIGDALSAAHQRGVIHGNLKPTNILFGEAGNVYLSDFSIARNLSPIHPSDTGLHLPYDPDYLAPEQIISEPATPETDIYSLSILLYEILTGFHPYARTPPDEMLHAQIHDPFPSLQRNNPELPHQLEEIIQRASTKSPAERYHNVLSLAADFCQAAASLTAPIQAPSAFIPEREIFNPYKGLRTFQEADADDFFGRQRSIDRLLNRLLDDVADKRLLAVVGPSGCGKSSLVHAGLIPALREGALPGSEKWFYAKMMPGSYPMEELEAALLSVAALPPPNLIRQLKEDNGGLARMIKRILPGNGDSPEHRSGNLLLFIDQFEEIFTRVDDEATREHFLDSLREAISDQNSNLWLVITLRADFYDRPLQYEQFGEMLRARTEILLPMNSDELVQAISGPAERAGVHFETGMAVAIATDVIDQPGALPLLQYALTELFEERTDRTITQNAYEQIGGVQGALVRRAEETTLSLEPESQRAAHQLFLRLVTLGDGVEDTRRRVLRTELTTLQMDPKVMDIAIDSFGSARLLTFDRDPTTRSPTVEIAHESLLREWPRLREWLENSRADVRMQRALALSASE